MSHGIAQHNAVSRRRCLRLVVHPKELPLRRTEEKRPHLFVFHGAAHHSEESPGDSVRLVPASSTLIAPLRELSQVLKTEVEKRQSAASFALDAIDNGRAEQRVTTQVEEIVMDGDDSASEDLLPNRYQVRLQRITRRESG